MNEEQLNANDEVTEFIKYDFSRLWLKTENSAVYGIIGKEYHRILIKFLMVEKNLINNNEYFVFGKSSVKGNVCEFIGKITIIKIQESARKYFGVDDEFKNQGIKTQGLLTAKYEFFENNQQNNSGYFSGILQTKWFLDKNDKMQYDDINSVSDGYFNNAFVGTWKMYNSNSEKICNWGDYRVPYTNCDFDIGTAELNISEKYLKNGWWVKPKKKWWE